MALHYITANPATSTPQNVLAILIHGGALSSRMYRTLTPHLKIQSIAVDLPGHGKSHQCGPFSFKTSTELLKGLIDGLQHDGQYKGYKIMLVGISLGGQAVLDFVSKHPQNVDAAIVSGASTHQPDDVAGWEMPKMPTDQTWLDLIMEDVGIVGADAAKDIQTESFAFTFDIQDLGKTFPPLLICIGENDTAMSRRDFPEIVRQAEQMNPKSRGTVINKAWHNHSIDIPEEFAEVINAWAAELFS